MSAAHQGTGDRRGHRGRGGSRAVGRSDGHDQAADRMHRRSMAGVAQPKPTGPVIYYRDPNGKPFYSLTPRDTDDGQPMLPSTPART